MMVIDEHGSIYRAVPNVVQVKDARGNWHATRQGWKPGGIPLMRLPLGGTGRPNRALDLLRASGELIELMPGEGK